MAKCIPGVNDLATVNPELTKEWHPTKNGDILPSQVTARSGQKVWWLGKCGHEWEAFVSNRSRGRGCPYCSGRMAIAGSTDLATVNPILANEWHPVKNGDLLPSQVTTGTHKKVWWLGKCGHEWQAAVAHRNNGRGCPVCAGKTVLPGANDLATASLKLAKEWHPTKNGGLLPSQVTVNSSKKVWWRCNKGHEWQATVSNRSRGNGCPYCSGKEILSGFNDLATTHPELAKEWHPTKNGELLPLEVMPGTNRKYWWQCSKCGQEWEATPNTRTYNKSGCPYCSGLKAIPGLTDLATVNPVLAAEWHPTKNGELSPSDVTASSGKKVWWLGKCGHEWQAVIRDRDDGHGCPVCRKEKQTSFAEQAIFFYLNQLAPTENRYMLDGKTEIDVYLPAYKIGIEYDGCWYHRGIKAERKEKRKNAVLQKAGITLIRVKEVTDLTGCVDTDTVLYCKYSNNPKYLNGVIEKLISYLGLKLDIDVGRDRWKIYSLYIENSKENSLAVLNPELAAEWHPTKNGGLLPSQVQIGSSKKVWWLGKCGHEWEAVIGSRKNGYGCPICSGRVKLPGFNDLATTQPELAAEWHPAKNGELTPEQVTQSSNKKVWWLGKCGHEWEQVISSRKVGQGCPYCAGVKVLPGFNDLATINPVLAAEWHPTKNGELSPSDVSKGSSKKVWWLGACGHEWEETIAHRHRMGLGCPICSNRRVLQGYNDLATVNPKLAAEWHPTKNGDLLPSQVPFGSGKKVWWRCSKCSHEWQAHIYLRNEGIGCMECYKRKRRQNANDKFDTQT